MRNNYLQLIGLLVVLVLQGCAIGYDSILFATKSNMGVDFDSAPPNLEVAISRQEGVFEPVFEGGQTVPVMASFASDSMSFTKFFWGVNSTFTMGEAAHNMTELYDSKLTIPNKSYVKVTVSEKPKAYDFFNNEKTEYIDISDKTPIKPSDIVSVRPVLFGTDTSLGIKVKWSGATAQYPSAINIGYKRKEVAVAPLAISKIGASGKKYEIDSPSLLATIDSDFTVEGGTKLTYLQYFATGAAANNLSVQPAVRTAMLKRADPAQDIQIDKALSGKQLREANRALIKKIQSAQNAASTDKKEAIIAKAKDLELINDSVNDDTAFLKALANHSDSSTNVTAKLSILETFATTK